MFLFIPPITQTFAPNAVTAALSKLDITLVYTLGIAACTVCKVGNGREVLKTSIPWNIILLLGGTTCLIGVMQEAGLAELITGVMSDNISPVGILKQRPRASISLSRCGQAVFPKPCKSSISRQPFA